MNSLLLGDDYVRGREKNGYGGRDGEKGEDYEAKAVQNHGCKLPIVLNGCRVLIVADFVGDHTQFFQN